MVKPRYYTELNKNIKTYGLITYFDKVTTSDEYNLITPENKINFKIEKKAHTDELTFELSKISSDQKIETKNNKTNISVY